MKRWVLCLCAAAPLFAHMVSISTGDLAVDGARIQFEMRMPAFEVAHVKDPARTLTGAISFRSNGAAGRVIESGCREDATEAALVCRAVYEFASPVEALEVRSALHEVTVPNHVHLLRATRGAARDQAVLDLSFPRTELRFRPPTGFEKATQQIVAGALRAAGGAAQWLFLAALVIAARTRRELAALTAMFFAGEAAACVMQPLIGWWPAPRFVEAACALTIAYLAVEILWLPQAGARWAVVGVLGLFHGLYLALFLAESKYSAAWVLTGAVIAEVALIAGLALVLSRLGRALESLQPARAVSAILLAVGLGWFFLRLRS